MLVEPSGFRTDWAGRSAAKSDKLIADYAATAGAGRTELRASSGKQAGDPVRAAQSITDSCWGRPRTTGPCQSSTRCALNVGNGRRLRAPLPLIGTGTPL